MADKDIVYTYHPVDGSFVYGVPQRDLTQADADKAGPTQMKTAVDSGLYRPAKETAAQRKEREKRDAEAAAAAIAAANSDTNAGGDGSAGDDDSGGAGEGNGQ